MSDTEDDVIKNPERGKQKPQEKYEPIYRQTGREPRNWPVKGATSQTKNQSIIEPKLSEETFSSFDNYTFDSAGERTKLDMPDTKYIDNNEFVFYDAPRMNKEQFPKADEDKSDEPEIGSYILMIFGKIVCFGNSYVIEDRIENILYGEDKEFADLKPSSDDIIVLKRVDIKVGVSIKND